ncbi:hypothetical protein Q3G72_030247 [Acer saccharum]|nr:hypothetical protein Q3G72_013334 [Acer saccharum]KAK1572286.1 hypothetical protein Q3G72_030247 [Acer saccharum]
MATSAVGDQSIIVLVAFTPIHSSGTSPGNTKITGNGNHQEGNSQNTGNQKKRGIWKKILKTFSRIAVSCMVAPLIEDALSF